MSAFDKFLRFSHLLDAVTAAIQEFVDPNTPDDKAKCKAALTLALQDWEPSTAAQLAEYISDAAELAGGGKDAVTHILQDIDYWFSSHNSLTPEMVHNMARDFLTAAQQAIVEVRGGKAMGS